MAYITKVGDKWVVRVRRKGHPERTATRATKALAEKWGREREAEMDAGKGSPLPRHIIMHTLFKTYTDEVSPAKPFGRNKAAVLKTLAWHLGADAAADMTASRIVRYITKDRCIKDVTAAIDLTYLEGVLRYARVVTKLPVHVEAVQEARDMLRHMGLLNRGNERDRRPTEDELTRIKAWFLEHSRTFSPDIIDFIIDSGFRPPSEILRLEWADLNENDRTIIIRDRKDPRKKIGNNQTVPLLGRCMDIILRQPRVGKYIFVGKVGTWSSTFPRAVKALKIVDLRLYDLRHESLSRLFESGKYSVPEVALVSGHKDWKQLARYTQLRAVNLHDR